MFKVIFWLIKNMGRLIFWLILGLLSFKAKGGDTPQAWFCTEESGKRDGRVLWACGVGESPNEAEARNQALKNALREFKTICEESSDCRGKKVRVEPKRLTCSSTFGGRLYKCYRLVEITLSRDGEVLAIDEE